MVELLHVLKFELDPLAYWEYNVGLKDYFANENCAWTEQSEISLVTSLTFMKDISS